MSESLFIVMPVYNEEGSIADVLNDWIPIVESQHNNRLLVINDGSKDSTLDILKLFAKDHPQLNILDKANSGHGSSIYQGYKYALEHEADYIFQTDSDGQTLASEFKGFWDLMQDKDKMPDAVMGIRAQRKDGASRVFVTKVLKGVIRMTMHADIEDANVPYRLIRKDALREAISYVPQNHNLTNIVLSTALVRGNKKIEWVPITFKPRSSGVNSINIRKIIKIGMAAVDDFKCLDKTLRNRSH